MKIYTKTGDKGETGLMGGKRLGKDSLRIAAYGDVDELNAILGICRALNREPHIETMLHHLQRELFELGADLSTPHSEKHQVPRVREDQVQQLERWIDEIDAQLKPLKNFILPGGGLTAAHLHLARTVCRRTERLIVALARLEEIGAEVVKYVNRLSDLLFMMARFSNQLEKTAEERWSV